MGWSGESAHRSCRGHRLEVIQAIGGRRTEEIGTHCDWGNEGRDRRSGRPANGPDSHIASIARCRSRSVWFWGANGLSCTLFRGGRRSPLNPVLRSLDAGSPLARTRAVCLRRPFVIYNPG